MPPPLCDDGVLSFDTGNVDAEKKLVLIYHDESIFYSNESPGWRWAEQDRLTLPAKGKGRGIMVSDFVEEHNGFLQLSDEEWERAKLACQLFKYMGQNQKVIGGVKHFCCK